MKYPGFLLGAISLLLSTGLCAADAPQTLAEEAAVLVASTGATWQSAAKEGTGARARARLILKTEDAAQNSSATLGDGSLREVRLEEKDGARTMTITRSLETVSKPNAKTQRILDRSALSFAYELKDTTLTLKGFPKGPTNWSVTTFTVPERDIVFKPLK